MKAKSFLLATLAVIAAACTPENPADQFTPVLNVSGAKNNTVEVGADAKDVKLTVSANLSWATACEADWITVDPAVLTAETEDEKATKVTVSIEANDVEEPREAEIVFAAEGIEPVKIAIKQAAKEHVFKTICVFDIESFEAISNYSISADGVGGAYKFYIQAEADWTTECPDWITLTPSSNTYVDNDLVEVVATIQKNSGEARNGEIKFKGDFESDLAIAVSQDKVATIALTIGEVTAKKVNFTTIPSSKTMLYMVMCETADYVDQFKDDAELFEAEIEYFEYLGSSYQLELSEVIKRLAVSGDLEDSFERDPDTDYVVYTYGITLDGELTTEIVRENVHTRELLYKFAGTAIWHDTLVDDLFSISKKKDLDMNLPCDVYTDDSEPGHYYFRSPYNFANIAPWFDKTPEEMYQYDGNWKDVYIDLDCSDPSAVVFSYQEIGCNLNSDYGWCSAGGTYSAANYNVTGVLEGDTISFSDSMLLGFATQGKIYETNTSGAFSIKLDLSATEPVYPAIPSAASAKSATKRECKLTSAKSASLKMIGAEAIR